jgi:hypothetical protein
VRLALADAFRFQGMPGIELDTSKNSHAAHEAGYWVHLIPVCSHFDSQTFAIECDFGREPRGF